MLNLRHAFRPFDHQAKGNNVVAAPVLDNVSSLTTVSRRVGVSGDLLWLPAKDLKIDPRYQRTINEAHVRKIARDFDPDAFGVLEVSERSDRTYWVMNGQHRHAAVMLLGWEEQLVPCVVHRGLTLEEEATIFYKPQTTARSLSPAERFRARIIASDPSATQIRDLVHQAGYEISNHAGSVNPRTINAIGAIEFVAKAFGIDRLGPLLSVIRDAWADTDEQPQGRTIRGLASFMYRYEGTYDRTRLIKVLKESKPKRIETDGIELTRLLGGKTEEGIGRTILRHYNFKLVARRLPDWDDVKGRK